MSEEVESAAARSLDECESCELEEGDISAPAVTLLLRPPHFSFLPSVSSCFGGFPVSPPVASLSRFGSGRLGGAEHRSPAPVFLRDAPSRPPLSVFSKRRLLVLLLPSSPPPASDSLFPFKPARQSDRARVWRIREESSELLPPHALAITTHTPLLLLLRRRALLICKHEILLAVFRRCHFQIAAHPPPPPPGLTCETQSCQIALTWGRTDYECAVTHYRIDYCAGLKSDV
ncbi:hypothetical protein FQA47_014649 [Oryzias melastigma]|uniref:Uncharacterized protein n=1 Tax=Oryzias melastigma TaxID=30732 RepID=A0A834FKW8_ORYME|nr:hypothetical protein FQA47_014649 [Oryzias melastigma]